MSAEETDSYARAGRKLTILWVVTMLALFAVMIVLGITMRLAQGHAIELQPTTFYAIMTMHGLGMAGTLYSGALAALWYVLARHVRLSLVVYRIALGLIVVGAVGLVAATLIGGFGPGWYLLYPLPFVNAAWPAWTTGVVIGSMMLLGVAWLLIQFDMLRATVAKYGMGSLLGIRVLRGGSGDELPSVVLIASVCSIAAAVGTVVGAATMMIYFFKWMTPETDFDPLLLKNMMLFFGHVIVNIAMYCGIGVVYELMPSFSKHPWKVNRLVAIAWNATLFAILFAYFHHLYMDFGQKNALQVFGQFASYLSALPATAVTIAGLFTQVHRSGIKWGFTPLSFFLGLMGWVIGGLAAVVDATISVNLVFHNTLWVPGHFHTYFLVGFVLIFLGFMHWLLGTKLKSLSFAALALMLVGGYGFVLMFYLGGVSSVPRRYASYQSIPVEQVAETGTKLATYGAAFGSTFLLGTLLFAVALLLRPKLSESQEPREPAAAGH